MWQVRIGYTVWTWASGTFFTGTKQDFERGLKAISDLGYQTVEDFNRLVGTFEDSPEEFDGLLEQYGLEFVNLYHYLRDDFDADFVMAERCCKFLKCHGGKLLNMQAPRRPGGSPDGPWWRGTHAPTEKDLDGCIEKLTKIAELSKGYGITTCLHPHWGTMVEQEHEVEYVAERTDPATLKLTLDTAHAVVGGMDPVKIFAQYVDRTAYVHLKDVVVPGPDPENPMMGFRELGRGIVDLRGVVQVLREGGYDGVLCVECDYPRVCNYDSAMISRQYIRDELGM